MKRTNRNLHVRGCNEEPTIAAPFEMRVQNRLKTSSTSSTGYRLKQTMADKLGAHNLYINQHGEDLPEIRKWTGTHRNDGGSTNRLPRFDSARGLFLCLSGRRELESALFAFDI